jgi:hypothetical protein
VREGEGASRYRSTFHTCIISYCQTKSLPNMKVKSLFQQFEDISAAYQPVGVHPRFAYTASRQVADDAWLSCSSVKRNGREKHRLQFPPNLRCCFREASTNGTNRKYSRTLSYPFELRAADEMHILEPSMQPGRRGVLRIWSNATLCFSVRRLLRYRHRHAPVDGAVAGSSAGIMDEESPVELVCVV